MAFSDLFFPKKNRDLVTVSIKKRIPILIGMDLMLVFYFLVASLTRLRDDPVLYRNFFVAIVSTDAFFFVSLAFIRARRYLVASLVATLATLLQTIWIGVFLPIEGSASLYRFVFYLMGAAIANSMVSLHKRQIPGFSLASLAVFVTVFFVFIVPGSGGLSPDLRSAFIVVFLTFIAGSVSLLFTNRLSIDLVAMVESELKENRAKAAALGKLLNGAKGSMEIGKVLLSATDESMARGAGIRGALTKLDASATGLSEDSGIAEESNKRILEYANRMKDSVVDQNAVIEETTTAITEIMATIRNIASLAQDKKKSIDRVLSNVELQGAEIRKVMESFGRIREASKRVLSVAGAILDVSEKTNMLAMNASIEAAHAGASGKGFAVISGQIRTLSEETKDSTQLISGALVQNEAVVKDASAIVEKFAANIELVVRDVRDTFNAIEEIINGLSEISVGTTELTDAAGNMVSIAKDTEETVRGVTTKLEESQASVAGISGFSRDLKAQVGIIVGDYSAIESILAEVKKAGERNIEVIATLEADLDLVNEG